MSEIYNTRLRKEFELLQKLERHPFNAGGIIRIFYKDRFGGRDYKSIMDKPSSSLYPNEFKVKYTFPIMYVGPGQVVRNWSYSFLFTVSEDILISDKKVDSDFFRIENGEFPDGQIPFNSHVSKTWFCIGSEWESSRGLGIWYFVVSIGGILNQDKSEMNIHETVHLNSAAYDYWVNDRNMKPNNEINWPFNLVEDEEKKKYDITFVDEKGNVISSQKLTEGTSISVPTAPEKLGFNFVGWIPAVPARVGKSNLQFIPQYKPKIVIKPKPEIIIKPKAETEKPKFTIKRK